MSQDTLSGPGSAHHPENLTLREHITRTLKLAGPVIVARSGILVLFTVDTIMVGQLGGEELAFLGLGMSLQGVLMLVCIGLLQGTMILSSQAYGAGEWQTCGRAWRNGIYHASLLGLVLGIICAAGEAVLLFFGQSQTLAAGGGSVSIHFGWGMPAMLLYVASSYFLESIQRPRVGMIVMLAVNILNVGLDGMLVFGWFGTGLAMGADGAVIATSAVRWVAALAMITYIITLHLRIGEDTFGIRVSLATVWHEASRLGGEMGKKMRALGAATGMAYGLESAAFASLVLMAGLIGPTSLAAHQITSNMVALLVMASIGMAAATAVRVGNAVGRQDQPGVRMAGWVGLGLVGVILLIPSLIILTAPHWLATLYVNDDAVLDIATGTMFVAGIFVAADGMMNVAMGALRGMGDVWLPMVMHIIAFWIAGVPTAWIAAFHFGQGAMGLQYGIAVAVFLSVAMQTIRFSIVSKRAVKRA
ncbi:MAG: MATE family efflux transporter [Parvibaculum sp.]